MDESTEQQINYNSHASSGKNTLRVDNILWTGLALWKIPFHIVGNAQRRILNIKKVTTSSKKTKGKVTKVQVLNGLSSVQMESAASPLTLELADATKQGPSKQIGVKDIMEIKEGQNTHAFQAFKSRHGKSAVPPSNLCFSIICADRSFDLYTEAPSLTAMMIEALRRLLSQFMSFLPSPSLKALTVAKLSNNIDPALNKDHFFVAAKSGDATTFLWYLEHGLSVDVIENDGRKDTALIAACRLGRINIVEIALKFNARNDPHPEFGQTALQVAVASGHASCVRLILETAAQSGADRVIVNHEDYNKEAPIHVASRCGNVEVLELLIDHGANMTLVDSKGRTCLHCTTQSGYHTCLDFLLSTGCNLMSEERDDQGYTCLHIAVKGNKIECARTLLEHGADPDAITIDGRNAYILAEKQKSEKMLQILYQFNRVPKLPIVMNRENLDYDNDEAQANNNLFEGLTLFNIHDGVRTPHKKESSDDYVPNSEYNQLDCFTTPCNSDNQLVRYDAYLNQGYPDHQSFYYNNELWFICFSSGHYYFLRDFDHYSQWYDPREFGIVEAEYLSRQNHINDSPDLSNNTQAFGIESSSKTETTTDTIPVASANEERNERVKNSINISNSIIHDKIESVDNKILHRETNNCPNSITETVNSSIKRNESFTEKHSSLKNDLKLIKHKKTGLTDIPNQSEGYDKIKVNNGFSSDAVGAFVVKETNQMIENTCSREDDSKSKKINNKITKQNIEQNIEQNLSSVNASIIKKPVGTFTENLEISKYNKMVAVGIPVESVVHKMKVDGVNQANVKLFLYQNDLGKHVDLKSDVAELSKKNISKRNTQFPSHVTSFPEEKTLQLDKNLLLKTVEKVGGDIKNAGGKSSGYEDNITAAECKSRFDKDETLSKYRKMASVGVPHQSVANKMRQEGIPANKIEMYEIAFGLKAACNSSQQPMTSPLELLSNGDSVRGKSCSYEDNITAAERKSRFDKDETLSKYRKMASVGVPHQSVANKMRQEGIPANKIEMYEIVFGLKAACNSSQQPMTKPLGLPCPPPITRRTSVKMQKIHWKAVSEEKLRDSLWADTSDHDSDIDDKEVKQLESLFGANQAKPSITSRKHRIDNSSNMKNSCLIDMKRANNVAISLAQYRSFQNYDDLCEAVISMDSARLNAEQLQNMKVLLPTTEELKKMKQYSGRTEGLVRAELFFLSVSKFPRFAQKLETFLFSLLFDVNLTELENSLSKLKKACEDIVSNKKLAAILRKLLAVGNLVNEGAGKPRARGITVDSLLKTAKRIGSDKKTTVIYIVVANFLKQDETGESVEFWNEMGSVRHATRININDCKTSLRELQMGIHKVHHTINNEKKDSCVEDQVDIPNMFLTRCDDFIKLASEKTKEMEKKLTDVENSVESLCSFFAEDSKTCQASTIFSLLLDFSRLVESAKDACQRKARAMKRRAIMNTPIKVSRSSPSPLKRNNMGSKRSITSTLSSIVKARSLPTSLPNQNEIEYSSWEGT